MNLPRRIYTDRTRTKILEEGEAGAEMLIGGAGQLFNTILWPQINVPAYFEQYPTRESKMNAASAVPSAEAKEMEPSDNKAADQAENKAVEAPQNTKAMQPKSNKQSK